MLPLLILGLIGGAIRLASDGKRHEPFTRFDHHLPLRGRWLRYAMAALLALLAIAIPILRACLELGLFPARS